MNQDREWILEEYRSCRKSLELGCYVAGGGAFGMFLRWLQLQLGFNELGLADPSLLHWFVALYVVLAAGVFIFLVRRFEKGLLYLPEEFPRAFSNEGKWYRIARIASGLLVCAGAALLFLQTDLDPHVTDYRVLAALALVAGLAFPLWLGSANRDPAPSAGLLCVLSFIPMFFLAAWIIICYKLNTINSVIWDFLPELVAAAASMFAFFRLGGYVFGRPQWQRCLFSCMLAAMLCILVLADERYLGLQVIFFGIAAELLLCCWIMVKNFELGEAPPKKKKNTGGFEELM